MFTDYQLAVVRDTLSERMLDSYDLSASVEVDAFKVTVEQIPDEHTTLSDYDCYGEVAYARRFQSERPAGFDGAARKIHTRDATYWWQPPSYIKDDPLALSQTYVMTKDILEYGFSAFTMRVMRKCECCGAYTEEAVSSVGGWEPMTQPTMTAVLDIVEYLIESL